MSPVGWCRDQRFSVLTTFGLAALFLPGSVLSQFADTGGYGQFGFGFDNSMVKTFQEPTYLIVASRFVRPGQIYRIYVQLFSTEGADPINIIAAIQRDGFEVAHASEQVSPGMALDVLMQVPTTSVQGRYKLRVEGNVNGVLGGTAFVNETVLEFSQRSMTIFVQTEKPLYMQGQIVKFRALPLTTQLKAFSDSVDVYMLNPNRTVMRRWLSRRTNLGAVSLEYPLSEQPHYGWWTIQVIAQGQVEEHSFRVEEYYQTRFEVNVTMPTYFVMSQEYVEGSVMANFTSGAAVTGNLTLRASVEPVRPTYDIQYQYVRSIEQSFRWFEGYMKFRFAVSDLLQLHPRIDGMKIVVKADVGERFLDLIESGESATIVFNSTLKLAFLGNSPQVYKPGMPFKAYLALSYHDNSPLEKGSLVGKRIDEFLRINVHGSRNTGNTVPVRVPGQRNMWEIGFDTGSSLGGQELSPPLIRIEATFFDEYLGRASSELLLYPEFSPSGYHIQVSTSTKSPKVGEYIIFHVRANYFVEQFSYLVVSKGMVLLTGQEVMQSSSIRTMAISLSAEMAPSATVIVFDVLKREGRIVADSLTFSVDAISKDKFTVQLNNRKDKTGDNIEVTIYGPPGTYVALSGLERLLYEMHAGTQLSYSEVVEKMNSFIPTNGTLKHETMSHKGDVSTFVNFPSSSYGLDANRTFAYAGLLVFTDASVTRVRDECNITAGYLSCYDGSCYPTSRRCDGFRDCSDGSDEAACPDDRVDVRKFRMFRTNRYLLQFTNSWLWKDINIGSLGRYIFTLPVPDVPSQWMISAFGMTEATGFGILTKPISVSIWRSLKSISTDRILKWPEVIVDNGQNIGKFSSAKPFYMTVEMPTRIRLGEQIGVRVTVFNYRLYETEVLVTLANSPDYKFVHVDPFGLVSSYRPKTSFGEHQHLVFVKAGKSFEVYMPIVPVRMGQINVTIQAKTQIAKDQVTKSVFVESDGIPQERHISMLLDLSQGAYLIKYLDTNITETPILPFREDRLYIFGSNRATVSIVGDVVGPAFPTMPVNATTLVEKPSFCGEQNMFNFAVNMWTLLYLRLTGQYKQNEQKDAFVYLNLLYQRQLQFQNEDGSFTVFRWYRRPSVWLTAFALRTFQRATFQEWEHYLYIDPTVIRRGMEWLLTTQSDEGSFHELSIYPYDRKMNSFSEGHFERLKYTNVSLTAHVLITLCEVKDLGGDVGAHMTTARGAARRYLEQKLNIIRNWEDPYELAIVAYALTIANSDDAEDAFKYLDERKMETAGMIYWGRVKVDPPRDKYENQRPYRQPRLPALYEASNVETTAYGLLTFVKRNAVIQKQIVEWLNCQRLHDSGWSSTQDTVMSMQALTEYTIQNRLSDVVDLTVTVDAPSTPGFTRELRISKCLTLISLENMLEVNESIRRFRQFERPPFGCCGMGALILQQRVRLLAKSELIQCFRCVCPFADKENLSKRQALTIPNAFGGVLIKVQGSGLAILQMHVQYNIDTWKHLVTQPPAKAFDLDIRQYSFGRNNSHITFTSCQRWTRTEESMASGMAVLELNLPSGYYVQQQKLDAYVRYARVRNLREARYQEKRLDIYFDYLDEEPICVDITVSRWYPVANMSRFISIKVYDYYAPERFNESMFEMYHLYAMSICHVCGSYQCPYCPVFSHSEPRSRPTYLLSLSLSLAVVTLIYAVVGPER
ncbi:C3 and PZP alpha-2-macroglobulin domain-containing protein 8-like [Tropilaelaps mercedesae]|uniref:C3 and PZP alpha-2-macroglobulin domain-containing protein 8-like n=1 Tax=Tropilaelaps mercedesae TaxID=418985 RepID=A0A1V9XS97_9ACAR|nr:C3 and PZP alpha-2-macroglobulin domain-containing protein 8-like [Tropilaelaps mercedesae]